MNKKKRIIIIILLIIFITTVAFLTNTYEEKLLIRKEIKTIEKKYNIFRKVNNFKLKNQERYITYYEKNKNLNYNDIVTYVNIGLDKDYYSYTTKVDLTKNNLILVNKYRKLDSNYIPNDLEEINQKYFINGNKEVQSLKKEAKIAFENLSAASIKNNTPVYGQSGYRSYNRQQNIYNDSLKTYGKAKTDIEIARPGFSEHQTGLAIDVSSTKSGNMLSFKNTDSYIWMINNAYKYGFILRYPKEKEEITGIIYEPWHFSRKMGKEKIYV